ncbi:MAG: Mrp/NBP35 family ATP-binding protein [Chloroflexi bacterium]|nr:MAG: Mrp/NBP35 family ATP-binding protein [Chloroflexota bacterium]
MTTPQALATLIVGKAVRLVKQLGGDIVGVVENMSYVAMPDGSKNEVFGPSQGLKLVIAVMSGKGGVGKSLVAGLLAVGLKRRGFTVGILDGDITGPSIPRMFGVREKPAVAADGKSLVPSKSRGGIPIMSMNLLLPDEGEAVIWRGPMVSGAIRQFFSDVQWGELDYTIVDLPPGTSDAPLTGMQALPVSGVVLVTTPQALATLIVGKAVRLVKQLGGDIVGVVENMSYVAMPDGSKNEVFGPSDRSRDRAPRRRRPHRVLRVAGVRGAARELHRGRARKAPAGGGRLEARLRRRNEADVSEVESVPSEPTVRGDELAIVQPG